MTFEELQERAGTLFAEYPEVWRKFALATCTGNRHLIAKVASPALLAEYDRVLTAAAEQQLANPSELERLRPRRDPDGALVGESSARIAVDMVVELLVRLVYDRTHLPRDWRRGYERATVTASTEVLFTHVRWGDEAAVAAEWQQVEHALRHGSPPNRAHHVQAAWAADSLTDERCVLLSQLQQSSYFVDASIDDNDVFGRCLQHLLVEVSVPRLRPDRWAQEIFASAHERFESAKSEHTTWLIICSELWMAASTFGATAFEQLTNSWQTSPEQTARDLMTAALFVHGVSGVPTGKRLAETASKLGRIDELHAALATVDSSVPLVSWWARFHDPNVVKDWTSRVRRLLD